MPRVIFTSNLRRHLPVPSREVSALNEPSFLGDPVTAVLPDERDRTLYAALNLGHFGVKMRRSTPAYDLVYRHGLAVDARGERLALGSTTGGLWISEDRGDTWQCVSSHMPPIYVVRFAD